MSWEQEREHFRILYPTQARPWFLVGPHEWEVIDLSEGGMRCRMTARLPLVRGEEIEGVLRFRRGEELPAGGSVLRIAEPEVVVRFGWGVTFRTMLDEQRHLIQLGFGHTW